MKKHTYSGNPVWKQNMKIARSKSAFEDEKKNITKRLSAVLVHKCA